MLDAWSPKEITSLLIQAGALGLCFLMMMIGTWALFQLIAKIDHLHEGIYKLAGLVIDRNARPPEITPPELRETHFEGDKTSEFPSVGG